MSVVDEVKERIDLTDYVSRHVHLEKSGRYFKGLCPFHTEKTPSFFVFPDDQRWHCFGCNRGGDIFNFVMELDGLDFRTALEELARQAGVALRPQTPQEIQAQSEAERLRALVAAAAEYYHTLLMTSPQAEQARDYLKSRGFNRKTVETFQLGYSMDAWDALRTHLLGQGFSVEEQVKAGMLVERDDGRTYDRFRDRVMIPIHDRRGRPIAFGGRVLKPEDQPKYMNSPQTPLFDKSRVLFGYHQASRGIRESDAAVIVEGYMDVMIPHQAGFTNIVAPMGTALSEAHLKQLQRLTKRFILALDPDSAGIHGTLQGLETARKTLDRDWDAVFDPRGLVGYEGRLKADIRVITLPRGLDPDELVLEDPDRWKALVASSEPVVRFYFHHMLQQGDPNEPKMKSRIVDAMLPLLSDIRDSIEREAYVQEIAQELELDARVLLDRLRAMERAEAVRSQAAVRDARITGSQSRPPTDMEAHVLTVLMQHPEVRTRVDALLEEAELEPIREKDFSNQYRLIWSSWVEMREHPELELEDFLPSDILEVVQGWLTQGLPEMSLAQWERDVMRTILRMRERNLRQILNETRVLLQYVRPDEEEEDGGQYRMTVIKLTNHMWRIQQALAQRPV
ncbi:MAG: DNA primase [Anaerolineae bacterium]